jgi:hypothetical protein
MPEGIGYDLTKSRIAAFEQCPKRLWLMVHRTDERNPPGNSDAFVVGHDVGALARLACAGGVLVGHPNGPDAVAQTAALIEGSVDAIFEGAFIHDGVLVRIDIMQRTGVGWQIAEVKAVGTPKGHHHADLATQLWVLNGAGLPVASGSIRHLNKDFVLVEEGNYEGLFTDGDVATMSELLAARAALIADARAVMAGDEPVVDMGDQCSSPHDCEFTGYCGRALPPGPQWPISLLPNSGKSAAAKWAEKGIFDLTDVPDGSFTNARHARIHRATCSGELFHDPEGARAMIDAWPFPRTYLDFETIMLAIPRWVGTSPFNQIPFQFSAHVEAEDGSLTHHEFLELDGADPRPACAEALSQLPPDGTVIAYYASFEKTRLKELAIACPQHATALNSLADRLVDLLPVAREHWYHRDQRGSWSIKHVLPTIAPELDYGGLDVANGTEAQQAFVEAISAGISDARKAEIDKALRVYCQRDTYAMVVILRRLCTSPFT